MDYNDEWSGLADFLANMIEKYAEQMNLDELPDPDRYYEGKQLHGLEQKCMEMGAETRQKA